MRCLRRQISLPIASQRNYDGNKKTHLILHCSFHIFRQRGQLSQELVIVGDGWVKDNVARRRCDDPQAMKRRRGSRRLGARPTSTIKMSSHLFNFVDADRSYTRIPISIRRIRRAKEALVKGLTSTLHRTFSETPSLPSRPPLTTLIHLP